MPPARPLFGHGFVRVRVHVRCVGGLLAAGLAGVASGCFYTDNGLSPPVEGFYFPTGLVVSPGRTALYVANSDFDLQYNGGTVEVVDLQSLRSSLTPLLSGIRCSGGNLAECLCGENNPPPCNNDAGALPRGTSLEQVCRSILVSNSAGPTNAACQTASDCASGFCLIGSDGIDGTCQPCQTGIDCPGPGTCEAHVCKLNFATNTYLTPAACTPLAPPVGKAPSGVGTAGVGSATIGAFASGAVMAIDVDPNDCDPGNRHARLFVPVRGDPSITWFDIADDRTPANANANPFQLDCGQTSFGGRCDDAHRLGVDPYENFRGLTIPVSPVGLDVSSDGTYVVSAHQIAGTPAIGLSVNEWPATSASPACATPAGIPAGVPSFQFYLTGSVAPGPSEVARVPEPALITQAPATSTPFAYEQGFVVTYNATAEVDIFRVDPDASSSPSRPFLTRGAQAPITINASGIDSRGVVIDPTERQACEASCSPTTSLPGSNACQLQPDLISCLACCVDTPLALYIANRSPPSLLLGDVRSQVIRSDVAAGTGSGVFDVVEIYDQVPLTVGPSKVVLGHALLADGTLKSYVFAVAFDTKSVFMYDPVAQAVTAVISTSRGPDPIAFDTCCDPALGSACILPCASGEKPHAFLYVGQFTDSYIGAVDLDIGHPESFGTMFASIGEPLPPLESK